MADKSPIYSITHNTKINSIILTIDFRGTPNSEEMCQRGLRRALDNGDLFKVISHNAVTDVPLLNTHLLDNLVAAFPSHAKCFKWRGLGVKFFLHTWDATAMKNAVLCTSLEEMFSAHGFEFFDFVITADSVDGLIREARKWNRGPEDRLKRPRGGSTTLRLGRKKPWTSAITQRGSGTLLEVFLGRVQPLEGLPPLRGLFWTSIGYTGDKPQTIQVTR